MYTPRMLQQGSSYTINYNPVINIRYVNKNSATESFDGTMFKITPKNLYRTVKFFNDIITWFYDKDKIDLFLRDDNDIPIFNADYKDLRASTGRRQFENCIMTAIPSIVEFENTKYEGITLYINRLVQNIPLVLYEVEIIFDILKNFSFQTEVSANLLSFVYAKSTNAIEDNKLSWYNKTGYKSGNIGNPFDNKK